MNKCDICKYKDCTMKETEERRATCEEDGLFERDMTEFVKMKPNQLMSDKNGSKDIYVRKDFMNPTVKTLMFILLLTGKFLEFEKIISMSNDIVDRHVTKPFYSKSESRPISNAIIEDLTEFVNNYVEGEM